MSEFTCGSPIDRPQLLLPVASVPGIRGSEGPALHLPPQGGSTFNGPSSNAASSGADIRGGQPPLTRPLGSHALLLGAEAALSSHSADSGSPLGPNSETFLELGGCGSAPTPGDGASGIGSAQVGPRGVEQLEEGGGRAACLAAATGGRNGSELRAGIVEGITLVLEQQAQQRPRLHQARSFTAAAAWRGPSSGTNWVDKAEPLEEEQPPPSSPQQQPQQLQPHEECFMLEASLAAWRAERPGIGADSASSGPDGRETFVPAPKSTDPGLGGNAQPQFNSLERRYTVGWQDAPMQLPLPLPDHSILGAPPQPAGGAARGIEGACNLEALLVDMYQLNLELEVWGRGGRKV